MSAAPDQPAAPTATAAADAGWTTKTQQTPPPTDPMRVARVIEADYIHEGHLTIRRWRGQWMRWERTHWAETQQAAVEAEVYTRLEHATYLDASKKEPEIKPWAPSRRKVGDLLEALAAITRLPEDVDPPSWTAMDRNGPRSLVKLRTRDLVSCGNGLLHIGTRELIEHTPAYFNQVAVPFDYDPDVGDPPRWLAFLDQLWPDDPDSISALQEFFGYVLSGRTDLQKIMLLTGPKRCGKGTIARVLQALVGKGNYAGPTLAGLGTNFGLESLLGKPLAVVADARLDGPKVDVPQIIERLLSISGEDVLTIDRKYRESWTGKLPTRFLIMSNLLPRFGDASGAIADRFVVLTLHESFLGRENHLLTDQLIEELPGIFGWALDGLDRLVARDRFTEPTSSADSVADFHDLTSPISVFVRDECRTDTGDEISVAELYAAWKTWCEGNGQRVSSVQVFGRDLRAHLPSLCDAPRPWRDDKTREPRRYRGISLLGSGLRPDLGLSRSTAVQEGSGADSGPDSAPWEPPTLPLPGEAGAHRGARNGAGAGAGMDRLTPRRVPDADTAEPCVRCGREREPMRVQRGIDTCAGCYAAGPAWPTTTPPAASPTAPSPPPTPTGPGRSSPSTPPSSRTPPTPISRR